MRNVTTKPAAAGEVNNSAQLWDESRGMTLFRFSWKWRRRSSSKVKERTHEEATEALRAGIEGRHPEAAFEGTKVPLLT